MEQDSAPLLKDLLNLDQNKSEDLKHLCLSNVFGDTFLIHNNRVFRRIRERVLSFGFQFSSRRSELYEALPFTQLEEILQSKVIPILENRKAVELVAKKIQDVDWIDIADGFRRCFAFHESCHAVARSTLQSHPELQNAPGLMMRTMLEESFANTCELLGVGDCHDLNSLAIYEANSYTALWEAKELIDRCLVSESSFHFVLLHYLRANFLLDSFPEDAELANLYQLSGAHENADLESLASLAYTLDETFRNTTGRLHLKFNGIVEPLNGYDPIQELLNKRELNNQIRSLCRMVLAEISIV